MDPISAAGGLFQLVGLGVSFMGQQAEAKAAARESEISQTITTFQAQQQAAQYSLYRVMQSRMQEEARRKGFAAEAQGFGAGINQAGSGYGFSSAAGGARGQARAEEGVAQGNIATQEDFAQQYFNLNQQINQQKIFQAQAQTQMFNAQGQVAMGQSIGAIGKDVSSIFGGFGTPSPQGGGGLMGLLGGAGAGGDALAGGSAADFAGGEAIDSLAFLAL